MEFTYARPFELHPSVYLYTVFPDTHLFSSWEVSIIILSYIIISIRNALVRSMRALSDGILTIIWYYSILSIPFSILNKLSSFPVNFTLIKSLNHRAKHIGSDIVCTYVCRFHKHIHKQNVVKHFEKTFNWQCLPWMNERNLNWSSSLRYNSVNKTFEIPFSSSRIRIVLDFDIFQSK